MAGDAGGRDTILAVFRERRVRALFVSELAQALRRFDPGSLDAQLGALSSDGAIVVAHHGAPDPHLEQADLRIVAPVEPDRPRGEAEAAAAEAAQTLWNTWLASFFSSHRCQ